MTTHFFTAVFPPIDHFFEESAVETGHEFSTIYIFMTLFVNNVYFKVSIIFLISFFIVKKRNKLSRNHIFNFFLFLRNEIKLMIILLDFVSPFEKHTQPFGYNYQNFEFRCEKTKDRFGTTLKIYISL